jgi:NAD(P)-dependent dehydrogenase (short-subunit alcohol dehydrogenase family)
MSTRHPGGGPDDATVAPAVTADRLTAARVLITGGSSGIGAATAKAFAQRGAYVAVAGRSSASLRGIAAQTGCAVITGDLRDRAVPARTVDEAATALGGLDIVVSNAGIGWAGRFASMSEADIDALLDVNLRAAAYLARAAIPHLLCLPAPAVCSPAPVQRPGRIVFVGSVAGLLGAPDETWYSVTKAGLSCLAEMLRAELRTSGIGVSLVSPGVVDTAFFERRQVPYARRHPKLISAPAVAHTIVDVVERGRDEAVVPAWLSLPARLKANFPGLYRLLATRFA